MLGQKTLRFGADYFSKGILSGEMMCNHTTSDGRDVARTISPGKSITISHSIQGHQATGTASYFVARAHPESRKRINSDLRQKSTDFAPKYQELHPVFLIQCLYDLDPNFALLR